MSNRELADGEYVVIKNVNMGVTILDCTPTPEMEQYKKDMIEALGDHNHYRGIREMKNILWFLVYLDILFVGSVLVYGILS